MFWDTALLAGIAIDTVLVLIAVTRPAWTDRLAGWTAAIDADTATPAAA